MRYGMSRLWEVRRGWGADRWDVEARSEFAMTPELRNAMLRGLIEERFQLKFHHEMRAMSTFTLVVAKKGAKLRVAADAKVPEVNISVA